MNEFCQEKIVTTPYQVFFDLEKEMNLFSMELQGIYYWQLIRFELLKSITIKNIKVTPNKSGRSLGKEILGVLKAAAVMVKKLDKAPKVDVLRIRPCVTLSRNGVIDDHQYDYMKVEHMMPVADLYSLGDYSEFPLCVRYSMAPAEFRLILWKIKRKLFGVKNIGEDNKRIFSMFLEKINRNYGSSFELSALISQINYSIACHMNYVKYYKIIYQIMCPKIIMVYPHYDEHMFAAIAAAKEMGIVSVEVQHGRVNAHEGYWYEDWDTVGKILPNYFFTYGKWWNQQIKLPTYCKPVAVGNVYLEAQVNKFQRNRQGKKAMGVFSSLQNGRELSKFIFEVNKFLLDKDICILYKLHPNEYKIWKLKYPELLKLDNAVIIDDDTSVYEIFSKSDIVFGINSTTFFEATIYNEIQILIYLNGDYEPMKPLLNNGIAKGVASKDEFMAILEHLGHSKNTRFNEFEIWSKNASHNMLNALYEILQKGEQNL